MTDFLTIECVQHGEFMHDTAKIDRLRSAIRNTTSFRTRPSSSMTASTTSTQPSSRAPIRSPRCEFTTDLPEELAWIPEFPDVEAVADWLLGNQLLGISPTESFVLMTGTAAQGAYVPR